MLRTNTHQSDSFSFGDLGQQLPDLGQELLDLGQEKVMGQEK